MAMILNYPDDDFPNNNTDLVKKIIKHMIRPYPRTLITKSR